MLSSLTSPERAETRGLEESVRIVALAASTAMSGAGIAVFSGPFGVLTSYLRALVADRLRKRLKKIPSHVAIIPDGNRRWARKRGLRSWEGHVAGYLRMRRILDYLWDLGVRVVTVYAMSYENCVHRPLEERKHLYGLLVKAVDDILSDRRVAGGQVRVRPVGELDLLPRLVKEKLVSLMTATARNQPYTLNVGVCYSGRWELVEAVKRAVEENVYPSSFGDVASLMPLGDVPEPDLVIRTGGEKRISNFLLWHIAYSELYFTEKLWPDFDELELVKALLDYQSRDRRFGR